MKVVSAVGTTIYPLRATLPRNVKHNINSDTLSLGYNPGPKWLPYLDPY